MPQTEVNTAPVFRTLRQIEPGFTAKSPIVRNTILTYAMALALIAGLALGSYVVLDRAIEENASTATLVNIAGRQRMLSQQIALLAGEVARANPAAAPQLETALAQMERAHLAQINADDLGISLPLSNKSQGFFFAGPQSLDQQVTAFIDIGRRLLAAENTADKASYAKALAERARGLLPERLNALVAQYEAEAQARTKRLRAIHVAALCVLMLTLVAEVLLIFQPLIIRLQSQLKELYRSATRDGLTGLANHHYFYDAASRDQALARREKQSCFLLLVDIDFLKSINEYFGNQAGDRTIVSLAKLLVREVRESDVPARIAGEEFGLVIRDASLHDAWALAERIRAACHRLITQNVPPLTVSIGITRLDTEELVEHARERANAAVIQARDAGGNSVATNL